ncbi:boule homolog, RNA binding protein isoform X8 [Haemaphysalis longicornis]
MTTTSSSTDSSSSSSPAGLNAPRYGTMVPNRVFVGGIATTTTEAELQELFSLYGHVTNTKIIVDRAGVSKGYGFVTFDTPEGAQRAQAAGNNNLMLRDRRLNVAPAIKKQPFTSRAYAPHHAESVQQATPTGTVVYHQNGVPYMYHNGTAFFHHPDTFYQYAPQAAAQNLQASSAAVATTSSPAATTTGYPILYQPYYPQQAFQYPNAWSAPNGQWRWAPPVPSVEGQEYHDPAIVETGSEGPRELAPRGPAPALALPPLLPAPGPRPFPPTPVPFRARHHHPHSSTPRGAHHRRRSSPAAHGSSGLVNGAIPRPPTPSSPLRTVPRVVNGISLLATPNSASLPNVAATPGPVGVTVSSARHPRLPPFALSAPDVAVSSVASPPPGTPDWQRQQCRHSAP